MSLEQPSSSSSSSLVATSSIQTQEQPSLVTAPLSPAVASPSASVKTMTISQAPSPSSSSSFPPASSPSLLSASSDAISVATGANMSWVLPARLQINATGQNPLGAEETAKEIALNFLHEMRSRFDANEIYKRFWDGVVTNSLKTTSEGGQQSYTTVINSYYKSNPPPANLNSPVMPQDSQLISSQEALVAQQVNAKTIDALDDNVMLRINYGPEQNIRIGQHDEEMGRNPLNAPVGERISHFQDIQSPNLQQKTVLILLKLNGVYNQLITKLGISDDGHGFVSSLNTLSAQILPNRWHILESILFQTYFDTLSDVSLGLDDEIKKAHPDIVNYVSELSGKFLKIIDKCLTDMSYDDLVAFPLYIKALLLHQDKWANDAIAQVNLQLEKKEKTLVINSLQPTKRVAFVDIDGTLLVADSEGKMTVNQNLIKALKEGFDEVWLFTQRCKEVRRHDSNESLQGGDNRTQVAIDALQKAEVKIGGVSSSIERFYCDEESGQTKPPGSYYSEQLKSSEESLHNYYVEKRQKQLADLNLEPEKIVAKEKEFAIASLQDAQFVIDGLLRSAPQRAELSAVLSSVPTPAVPLSLTVALIKEKLPSMVDKIPGGTLTAEEISLAGSMKIFLADVTEGLSDYSQITIEEKSILDAHTLSANNPFYPLTKEEKEILEEICVSCVPQGKVQHYQHLAEYVTRTAGEGVSVSISVIDDSERNLKEIRDAFKGNTNLPSKPAALVPTIDEGNRIKTVQEYYAESFGEKFPGAAETLAAYAHKWKKYSGTGKGLFWRSRKADHLSEIDQAFIDLASLLDKGFYRQAITKAEYVRDLALSLWASADVLNISPRGGYLFNAYYETCKFLQVAKGVPQSVNYYQVYGEKIKQIKQLKKGRSLSESDSWISSKWQVQNAEGRIIGARGFAQSIDLNILANKWETESNERWKIRPACFKRLDSILSELKIAVSNLARDGAKKEGSEATINLQRKFDTLITRFYAELNTIYHGAEYHSLSPVRQKVVWDFLDVVTKGFLKASGKSEDDISKIERLHIPSVSKKNAVEYGVADLNFARAGFSYYGLNGNTLPKLTLKRGIPLSSEIPSLPPAVRQSVPLPSSSSSSLSAPSVTPLNITPTIPTTDARVNSTVCKPNDGINLPLLQAYLATWCDEISNIAYKSRPDEISEEIDVRIGKILRLQRDAILGEGVLKEKLRVLVEAVRSVLYFHQDELSPARRAALRSLVHTLVPTYKDIDMLERMSWVLPANQKPEDVQRTTNRIIDNFFAKMDVEFSDLLSDKKLWDKETGLVHTALQTLENGRLVSNCVVAGAASPVSSSSSSSAASPVVDVSKFTDEQMLRIYEGPDDAIYRGTSSVKGEGNTLVKVFDKKVTENHGLVSLKEKVFFSVHKIVGVRQEFMISFGLCKGDDFFSSINSQKNTLKGEEYGGRFAIFRRLIEIFSTLPDRTLGLDFSPSIEVKGAHSILVAYALKMRTKMAKVIGECLQNMSSEDLPAFYGYLETMSKDKKDFTAFAECINSGVNDVREFLKPSWAKVLLGAEKILEVENKRILHADGTAEKKFMFDPASPIKANLTIAVKSEDLLLKRFIEDNSAGYLLDLIVGSQEKSECKDKCLSLIKHLGKSLRGDEGKKTTIASMAEYEKLSHKMKDAFAAGFQENAVIREYIFSSNKPADKEILAGLGLALQPSGINEMQVETEITRQDVVFVMVDSDGKEKRTQVDLAMLKEGRKDITDDPVTLDILRKFLHTQEGGLLTLASLFDQKCATNMGGVSLSCNDGKKLDAEKKRSGNRAVLRKNSSGELECMVTYEVRSVLPLQVGEERSITAEDPYSLVTYTTTYSGSKLQNVQHKIDVHKCAEKLIQKGQLFSHLDDGQTLEQSVAAKKSWDEFLALSAAHSQDPNIEILDYTTNKSFKLDQVKVNAQTFQLIKMLKSVNPSSVEWNFVGLDAKWEVRNCSINPSRDSEWHAVFDLLCNAHPGQPAILGILKGKFGYPKNLLDQQGTVLIDKFQALKLDKMLTSTPRNLLGKNNILQAMLNIVRRWSVANVALEGGIELKENLKNVLYQLIESKEVERLLRESTSDVVQNLTRMVIEIFKYADSYVLSKLIQNNELFAQLGLDNYDVKKIVSNLKENFVDKDLVQGLSINAALEGIKTCIELLNISGLESGLPHAASSAASSASISIAKTSQVSSGSSSYVSSSPVIIPIASLASPAVPVLSAGVSSSSFSFTATVSGSLPSSSFASSSSASLGETMSEQRPQGSLSANMGNTLPPLQPKHFGSLNLISKALESAGSQRSSSPPLDSIGVGALASRADKGQRRAVVAIGEDVVRLLKEAMSTSLIDGAAASSAKQANPFIDAAHAVDEHIGSSPR